MNRSLLRLCALLLVLPLCASFLVSSLADASAAQDPKPTPEGRGTPPQDGPERPRGPRGERGAPNLHNSMEQMERVMDQVQATIGDPAKSEDTLMGLGRMIQLSGSSLLGQPKNMDEQPEDKRAAHKNAFRREMLLLTRQLIDIDLLVLDGKHEDAAKLFKAKIAAARDAGHEKFGGDEEKGAKPAGGADAPPPKK
ncbi:MAG: hypothetical protein JNL28_02405 [Planctomycetes bacterium]|nr:hypothetical protein [Planctomycetota bacterium]